MRSYSFKVLGLLIVLSFTNGCGDKKDPVTITDSGTYAGITVTYETHIKDLMAAYCLSCHSITVQGAGREGAPEGINFDTYEDVVTYSTRISARISGGTMPPGGGMPDEDRELFQAWIDAGKLENIDTEFVAADSFFSHYADWEIVDNVTFPTNLDILEQAHQGADEDYSRWIYSNAEMADDQYTLGSIILKETFTWVDGEKQYAESGGILAMAKRGGSFNPEGNGWEWFELSTDTLGIIARGGAEMADGSCNACHAVATGELGSDFVFRHPAEYVAAADEFNTYKQWDLIGEESGEFDLLSGAHLPDSTRMIYKSPYLANPKTQLESYPTGTILLKEVSDGVSILEITAMVKRSGEFNPDNGGWEWFMIDPENLSVIDRGANILGNVCNDCHLQANTGEYGIDYVFQHDIAPFNHGEDETDIVTYSDHIRPLIFEIYCLGCHSSTLSGSERSFAPVGVDFDTYELAVANADRANVRIQADTMPPGDGMSGENKALFSEWLETGTLE